MKAPGFVRLEKPIRVRFPAASMSKCEGHYDIVERV